MSSPRADISENDLLLHWPGVLELLISDRTSKGNILWATEDYSERGGGYRADKEILLEQITGGNGDVIVPRTYKHATDQAGRTKGKAEVFTPVWVVNAQLNLVDGAWFGYPGSFNSTSEDLREITPNPEPIKFPDQAQDGAEAADDSLKTWQSYVRRVFLEIACGEAPYMVNRYDAADGTAVEIGDRIGALDRKLRVISENADEGEWLDWVKIAYRSSYGYEWQGDSLLIARENLLFTFFDVYRARYGRNPELEMVLDIAEIISWNLFQMDGLKYVVPGSCREDTPLFSESLFGEEPEEKLCCPGCARNDVTRHNGIYAKTMDWRRGKPVRFVDLRVL